jgi:hypothetical protein
MGSARVTPPGSPSSRGAARVQVSRLAPVVFEPESPGLDSPRRSRPWIVEVAGKMARQFRGRWQPRSRRTCSESPKRPRGAQFNPRAQQNMLDLTGGERHAQPTGCPDLDEVDAQRIGFGSSGIGHEGPPGLGRGAPREDPPSPSSRDQRRVSGR